MSVIYWNLLKIDLQESMLWVLRGKKRGSWSDLKISPPPPIPEGVYGKLGVEYKNID